MPGILTHHEHRPWSLPRRPWVMAMSWQQLLFAHWPVPADCVRATLPPGLELDTCHGAAWLAVVPLLMSGVRARGIPALPYTGRFEELNVRTYVIADGKPGVWFYSLDAANALAVRVARKTYGLPYFDADMQIQRDREGWVSYRSRRRVNGKARPGEFVGRYRPVGDIFHAQSGTFEHWCTERYALYALDRKGRLCRGEVHHAPWPLQRAEAQITLNTAADHTGLRLPATPPHLLYADRLDVVAWWPVPIA